MANGGVGRGKKARPLLLPLLTSLPTPPHPVPPRPARQTTLHRIYGKFLSHRSFIRKAISHVFFRFVFETERHNGIGELLEILGSIINGFALPLKEEHVQFLERALIPLHRPRCVGVYFQQLVFCMLQYIEKDAATVANVVRGVTRCWPGASSAKQILLLNELEELLEVAGAEAALPVAPILFALLARCVGSPHFQVSERALFLWNNEALASSGVLSRAHAALAVPVLYAALHKQASGHWNPTVETLARNVVKHYEEADPALYDRTAAGAEKAAALRAERVAARKRQWAELEDAVKGGRMGGGAGSGASVAEAEGKDGREGPAGGGAAGAGAAR